MFASLTTARRTLDDIAVGFDAAALSPVVASRVVDELGAIRRVVDGLFAKTARRVAETSTEGRDAAAAMARLLGVSAGEVRGAIETARLLEALPDTDRAVREGRLSGVEAKLIAAAATRNPAAEGALLDAAARGLHALRDACVRARAAVEEPGERAERQQRSRHFRMWTDRDGMLAGRFAFPPEIGGALKAAIDAEVQRIFRAKASGIEHEPHEAYAADAVADWILNRTTTTDTNTTAGSGRVDATVHVIVDHGALMRGGTAAGEVCEIPGVGPVDINWVRELLGSAFLTVVIKKGKDILTVAHLGRHVPAEVMTALVVAGRECDIEGCEHRGYLERDHINGYANGGITAYANLAWLCYRHHRRKTAGWTLGTRNPTTRKRTLRAPPAKQAA